MTKISAYPEITQATIEDLLIGTDVETQKQTKNFSVKSIVDLIEFPYLYQWIKSDESLSLAKRNGDVLYSILDKYTGEEMTLSKVTGTPVVDGIIYFQLEDEYFKRNSRTITPQMFGAKADGLTNDTAAIQATINFCQSNNEILEFKGNFVSNTITISNNLELETDCNLQTIDDVDALVVTGRGNGYGLENMTTIKHNGNLTLRGVNRENTSRGIVIRNGANGSSFDKVYLSNFSLGVDYEASGNNNGLSWNFVECRQLSKTYRVGYVKGDQVSNTTLYNIGEITTTEPLKIKTGFIVILDKAYPIVKKPNTTNIYYVGDFYNMPIWDGTDNGKLWHCSGGGILHQKWGDNGAIDYKTLNILGLDGSSLTVQSLYGITVNGGEIEGNLTNICVGGIYMNGNNPETMLSIRSTFSGIHTEGNVANDPIVYSGAKSNIVFDGCLMANGIRVAAPETGVKFHSWRGSDRLSNIYFSNQNDFPGITPINPDFKIFRDVSNTSDQTHLTLADLVNDMDYMGDIRISHAVIGEFNFLNIPLGDTRVLRVSVGGSEVPNTINGGTSDVFISVKGVAGIDVYKITFVLKGSDYTYYLENTDFVQKSGDTMTGDLTAPNIIAEEDIYGRYTRLKDVISGNFLNSGADATGSFLNSLTELRFLTGNGNFNPFKLSGVNAILPIVPSTSVGTFDMLTRDTITGNIEKMPIGSLFLDSVNIGSITPLTTIPATINVHGFAVEDGTYTNCGDVVVPINSISFLSRIDGVWGISTTEFDFSGKYIKIAPWTAKSYLSGDQVNHLGKDWVSNAAIVAGDVPGTSSKWVDRLTGYLPTGTVSSTNTNAISGQSVNSYLGKKSFLNKYLKPNDLIGNPAYSIYDNINELSWGYGTNATFFTKTKITLPSDFNLPFEYAINLKTIAPTLSSSNMNFAYKIGFNENLITSNWSEIEMYRNAGVIINYVKGYNDVNVKSISALRFISPAEWDSIVLAIDTNGFWENVQTDYTMKATGYYNYNGRLFLHISVRVTVIVAEVDFIQINFGYNPSFPSGESKDMWYFGFQAFEGKLLNQFDGEPKKLSIGEAGVFDYKINNAFEDTFKLDNKITDFFNGGGKVVLDTDGVSPALYHNGNFILLNNLSISEKGTHSYLQKYFKLTYNSGAAFPKYESHSVRNNLIVFDLESYASALEKNNATFTFWIDRTELNGNGLIFHDISGANWMLRYDDLVSKGFKESRVQGADLPIPIWEVVEVFGNYTCLKFNIFNNASGAYFNFAIYNTSDNEVTELTIFNPTLIYNKNSDPFYNYKSQSEKNNSTLIGKTAIWLGDSQYNDDIALIEVAKFYGLNIIDAHYGGHRMAILGEQRGNANYNSFYNTNLRNKVMAFTNVDLYIFTTSTNDGAGGGDLSTTAVQAVYDNYPVYGDDGSTVAAKMALFNTLTNVQVDTIFAYKNTYSSYIKQIQETYPNAMVMVCSVPITCTGQLTGVADGNGKGIWYGGFSPDVAYNTNNAGRQQISTNSKEISVKHNTLYADLLNEIGLTYWNFTTFCVDSTHWLPTIKYRIAQCLINEIKKIK